MNIGVSMVLITVGAILAFAVEDSISGVDLSMVGVILLLVGIGWLILTLVLWGTRRSRLSRGDTMVEERRVYDDRPTVYDEPPLP
jgi:hypothetical protein